VSRGGPAVTDDACIEDFGHGSVGVWERKVSEKRRRVSWEGGAGKHKSGAFAY
jgi:hypothetical protein